VSHGNMKFKGKQFITRIRLKGQNDTGDGQSEHDWGRVGKKTTANVKKKEGGKLGRTKKEIGIRAGVAEKKWKPNPHPKKKTPERRN